MSSDVEDDTAQTGRPLRKDAARNRELLIAAGRDVFAERGLDASLDDIARQAGVGVGTAYRHFANKHELARAIFTEAIDEMIAHTDAVSVAEDPWDGLVSFIERAAEQQTRDRGLREVLSGVHDPDELDRITGRMSGPLNHLIARAKHSGALREDVVGTDLWLAVTMLCTVADMTADVRPDLWRRYLPMLLDTLRSGTGTPLPVPPIDEDSLRAAVAGHHRRTHGRCADS